MSSRPDNFPDDPFKRLKEQFRLHVKEAMVSQKILTVVKDASKEFLTSQNIILSRTEQNRLIRAILPELVDDVLNEL
jgi:hypothetical protein